MNPEKKPLRLFATGRDTGRAGWYMNDEWYCVGCPGDILHDGLIPRGAPVFYAGVRGLFYCVKHAPGDALGAPAWTEEA
jgi:hypothetical protein